MARTLTAGQETERKKNYVKIVVLVEVDADAPDAAPTTQRYASRKYTLSSNLYSDALSPDNPIETSWARLRVGGGLAAVAGFSVKLANQEKLSNLIDTYFLENDTARLYMIFVTGSETSADRIQLAQGVIENFPFSLREFSLQVIDASSKDFRAFPAEIIDQTTFPNAPLDVLGKPMPLAFGSFEDEFRVNSVDSFFLAPAINTDLFGRVYCCGRYLNSAIPDIIYRWYPEAKQLVKWAGPDPSLTVGEFFDLSGSSFRAKLSPVLPMPTNNIANWYAVCDGKTTTGASMINGDDLDVYMGGFPKRGSVTGISLVISANNNAWSYVVKLRGTTKASGAAASSTVTVTLTAADHADDWDFEQYTVEIDATGTTTIQEIYLDVNFDDQESSSAASFSMPIFALIQGFRDIASYYRDGSTLTASPSNMVQNCADVLHAILRAKVGLNLPVARINTTSFTTARGLRTNWNLAFSLISNQVDINWINTLCFESGLSLFLAADGTWQCIARAKNKAPNHVLLHQRDVIVLNKDQSPAQWDYDFRVSRTPMRDLINEVVLRYRLERASGEYVKMKAATGHYRVTGTNAVVVRLSDTTGTVTSSGATFQTSGVVAGDIVYVWGHLSYTVTTVNSETQVTVSGSEVYDDTGRTFYIGPNVDSRMVRSQVRHKTENPLGTPSSRFFEEGGYRSDLIASDTTAQNFIDHLATFRAFSRLTVELGTYWNAVNMELGDIVYLDHPWLPTERRPFLVTTINGAQTSGDTTIDVAAGDAELFQVDDYILVGTEIMKVTGASGANAITVTRGQLSTTAVAYVGGEQIRRFENKWEVIGIKPEPLKGEWRLELEELPLDYTRIGMAVADGYADYTAATTDQITVAGWATENSGRALESDENSDISYAI